MLAHWLSGALNESVFLIAESPDRAQALAQAKQDSGRWHLAHPPELLRGPWDPALSGGHRMPPANPNISASLAACLPNLAKQQRVDFHLLLVRFALQSNLCCQTLLPRAECLLPMGSLLLRFGYDSPHRAPRDRDLLGFDASDLASAADAFPDIANPSHF
jgi:hypothetical protein